LLGKRLSLGGCRCRGGKGGPCSLGTRESLKKPRKREESTDSKRGDTEGEEMNDRSFAVGGT